MMSTPGIFVFIIFIKIKLKYVVSVRKRTMRVNVNYVKLNVNYSLIFDDNRNNLVQLDVHKRTCFVGTAIFSNWTAIIIKILCFLIVVRV